MTSRVAVLVDGDNLAADHGDRILSLAEGFGRIDIARVYADARNTPKWADDTRFRLVHAGSGKNASDILLVIEAMEMALGAGIGTFVIASSDQDFMHLVRRLREMSRTAIGVGEAKTLPGFRANCSEFLELPPLRPAAPCSPSPLTPLDQKIRTVVALHDQNGTGMPIACLGNRIRADHGVCIKSHPDGSWRNYLEARPALYNLDPRGPKAKVRLRPPT